MGFILFWTSWVFHLILRLAFCWYKPLYFFTHYGWKQGWTEWNRHNLHQAMAEDQAANVSLFMVLNKLFTRGASSYHYGDEDDTISYASAMSYHKGGKDGPATNLVKFLRFVDKDHDTKAINGKILRDLEAMDRLQKAGVIEAKKITNVSSNRDDEAYKLYVAHIMNEKRIIKL